MLNLYRFIGPFCEISICHNYCLRGKCIINHRGLPECECTGTFSGARCERDVCNDYCLFDGKCSVQNGRPFCSCKYSKGSRCEEPNNIAEVCAIYCASNYSESPSASMMCRYADISLKNEIIIINLYLYNNQFIFVNSVCDILDNILIFNITFSE